MPEPLDGVEERINFRLTLVRLLEARRKLNQKLYLVLALFSFMLLSHTCSDSWNEANDEVTMMQKVVWLGVTIYFVVQWWQVRKERP